MIAVVDYKAGNLTSVVKSLRAAEAELLVTEDPDVVRRASKIVLPGVGHFAATQRLKQSGMTDAIKERVGDGVPFLGICVGLQWLFQGSSEAPGVDGLCAFAGSCERFPATDLKVPHVGWNTLEISRDSKLLADVASGEFVYFTHSYCAPLVEDTLAVTNYGRPFTSAVARENVVGVQFHPEKSGAAGLKVLHNFVRLAC